MYQDYIELLHKRLEQRADAKIRDWWEGYVKQSAPFIGVKMPVIRTLLLDWHKQALDGKLNFYQQRELALAFLREKHSEDKLAGILFLQEILMPAGVIKCNEDLNRFAELFVEGSIYDWNICDWFCVKVLGPLIESEGEACALRISEWRYSSNLWQARASLVAFVKVAENHAYYPLIRESCEVLIRRDERFAKTAVGWILRDISKYDDRFAIRFVEENIGFFSLESLRNALKYLPKEEKDPYIQLFKKR